MCFFIRRFCTQKGYNMNENVCAYRTLCVDLGFSMGDSHFEKAFAVDGVMDK